MPSKCSLEKHKENNAISFCIQCKIYMCNKCENFHSELFPNHHLLKITQDKNNLTEEIFTGLCQEKNHFCELKYFCKSHNKLCCAECITKIKGKDHGQHTDCTIASLTDIKDEKSNKLKGNIKSLEELSLNLKEAIDNLKTMFKKLEEEKEELKMKIQTVFTKLRNSLNAREDELLSDVDKKFEEEYFNEDLIKEAEKLPKKIKTSLDKGKSIDNNEDIILNSFINDCINIENNIKEIDNINSNIIKCNAIKNKVEYIQYEDDLNQIIEKIKKFGKICCGPDSEIINTKDANKINSWIGKDNTYKLLYSAKKDTCNTDIFHKKCDNKEGIIIVCKVQNSDVIGAYISTKIEKVSKTSADKNAFLFNLTKNIIKKNKKQYNRAITNFSDSSNFIKLGDCSTFSLSGNCVNDEKSYFDTCGCDNNFDCSPNNIFDEKSGSYRKIENFEVFQII